MSDKLNVGNIYTFKKKNAIWESVYWDGAKPLALQPLGKDKVRFRSLMIPEDSISRNNRKYIKPEIMKSTNTWVNRPVTVNHAPYSQEIAQKLGVPFDQNKIIGNSDGADYEEGVGLWVTGVIKKYPYVDMLRNKSTEILGTSAEADYLFNECSLCHKKFDNEESWRDHMVNEEFIKDLPTEPHGIIGKAVTLVLSPEMTGLDTTLDVMETKKGNYGLPRLYEMILKEKGGFGVEPQATPMPIGKASIPKLKEKPTVTEKVEQRGDKWCVVHCHGDKAGEPIKCFDTEAEAQAMHAAMQADKKAEELTHYNMRENWNWLKANAPKEWVKLLNKFLTLTDEIYTEYEEAKANLPEIQRQNELKARELAIKESLEIKEVQELKEDNTQLAKVVLEQEKRITEMENEMDKQRGKFKAGAAGNEMFEIKLKQQQEKKPEPDFSYKGG